MGDFSSLRAEKNTNLGVLTCSEAIQQMSGREEVPTLYMATAPDEGGGR